MISGCEPIHGLRHAPAGHTAGWYIWTGDYAEAADFYKPMHVAHLIEASLNVVPYLGLAPGWRFVLDNRGYEDCWFDASLLNLTD